MWGMFQFRYETDKSGQDMGKDQKILNIAQFTRNKRKVHKIIMSLRIKIACN